MRPGPKSITMLMTAFAAVAGAAGPAPMPEGDRAKASYALGVEAGNNLKRYALDVDPELLLQGLRDALSGHARLSDEEVRKIVRDLRAAAARHATAPNEGAGRLATPRVTSAEFSFKVDPRLTRGLYMGDRWLTVPTFVGANGQDSVTTRIKVHDAQGKPITVKARWIPADADMMTITPSEGEEVTITVRRAGESRVEVVAEGIREELKILATLNGEAMNVRIARGG